jgi:hypothetical protein
MAGPVIMGVASSAGAMVMAGEADLIAAAFVAGPMADSTVVALAAVASTAAGAHTVALMEADTGNFSEICNKHGNGRQTSLSAVFFCGNCYGKLA